MADKPDCGSLEDQTGDSIQGRIVGSLGGVGTVGTIAEGIFNLAGSTEPFVLWGIISAPTGMWLAAIGGAAFGLVIIGHCVVGRLWPRKGSSRCYAGVVTSITPSFSDGWSNFAPYAAQHDRVDVVVKPDYWELVASGNEVFCDTDSLESPLIRSYYHSTEIVGAAIGSGIGGIVGAILGILAAAALVGGIAAAAGCATVVGCPIGIVIALILLAFAAALLVVLALALIGGQIGRAVAGDSDPVGSAVSGAPAGHIAATDYVSINGNMLRLGDDNNAIVAWWVETTTIHGRSASGEGTGGSSPFPFTDPRDNLNPDACKIIKDTEPAPED